MGAFKTEIFTEEQNRLAIFLKVLAHPARIAIIQRIMLANTCICGDLIGEIGLTKTTISQHLKELKNAGIIQGTIERGNVCYCINPAVWRLIERELGELLFAFYKGSCSCC